MSKLILIFSALLLLAGNVWAGDSYQFFDQPHNQYANHDQLYDTAKDLEKASHRLFKRLRKEIGRSQLTRASRLLARGAKELTQDIAYGANRRTIRRRLQTLSDCFNDISAQFHHHHYAYLSRKASRRLDRVGYALHDLEEQLYRRGHGQYSYHQQRRFNYRADGADLSEPRLRRGENRR